MTQHRIDERPLGFVIEYKNWRGKWVEKLSASLIGETVYFPTRKQAQDRLDRQELRDRGQG